MSLVFLFVYRMNIEIGFASLLHLFFCVELLVFHLFMFLELLF